MIRVVVLGLLALSARAGPRDAPEEVAAMLLSPDPSAREGGLALLKEAPGAYTSAVLKAIAGHAFNRGGWIVELEKRSKKASGELLARTHRMLALLNDSSEENLGVEVYFVRLPKELAAGILGGAESVVYPPQGEAWKKWWVAVRGDRRSKELLRRAIAGRDGRPVMTRSVRKTSYVEDLVVVDQGSGRLRTVLGEVEAGLTIRWTPRLSPDGRTITLATDLTLVTLKKPIAVEQVRRGSHKVQVQRPEVTTTRRQRTLTLPVRGYAAIRVLENEEEETVAILLLRAAVGKPLPLLAPPRATGGSAGSGR